MNFISIHISEKWGQDTTGLKYWRCACQNVEEFRTPEKRKKCARMCWTQKQIRCSGFCKWLLSVWCSSALCWVRISWILLEFWERKARWVDLPLWFDHRHQLSIQLQICNLEKRSALGLLHFRIQTEKRILIQDVVITCVCMIKLNDCCRVGGTKKNNSLIEHLWTSSESLTRAETI